MSLRDIDSFNNSIICVVDNKQLNDNHNDNYMFVYLQSSLPVYLGIKQKYLSLQHNNNQGTTYTFLKCGATKSKRLNPCIDTFVLSKIECRRLFRNYILTDVTDCSSYNDVLAVRMALAKNARTSRR